MNGRCGSSSTWLLLSRESLGFSITEPSFEVTEQAQHAILATIRSERQLSEIRV